MKLVGAEPRSGMVAIAADWELSEHNEAKGLFGNKDNNRLLPSRQTGTQRWLRRNIGQVLR
jgi:hypothetical protein